MPLSPSKEVDKGRMLLGRAEALAEKDGLERSEIPSTQQPQPSASISHPPEKEALQDPISTFSLNVSDVSFELAKASLEQGRLPDPVHIRSEQFLNAFDYQDPLTHSQESISFSGSVDLTLGPPSRGAPTLHESFLVGSRNGAPHAPGVAPGSFGIHGTI